MSKTNQKQYFNYNNLQSYVNQMGLNYDGQWLRWLKDIVNTKIGMFNYKNLPNELTSDIIERALMFNNHLCMYYSKALDELVLCRWLNSGNYDKYWYPKKVDLLTLTGKPLAQNVPFEDIVLCRDNRMDIIPFLTCNSWIEKIIELEKTFDIVIKLIRFPSVISGDKEEVAQLKALLKKNADCEGFIIAKKNFSNNLEQFDISIPCSPTELYEMIDKYKDMTLSSIGIYSVDEKRERIVTEEIEASNDFVDFIYQEMVNCRQEWIDAVNTKYGYEIELEETYDMNKKAELELQANELETLENIKTEDLIEIEEVKNEGKKEVSNDGE